MVFFAYNYVVLTNMRKNIKWIMVFLYLGVYYKISHEYSIINIHLFNYFLGLDLYGLINYYFGRYILK